MLIGSHVIVYAQDANATRAFFRDTLGFTNVDAGEGWLIFALPPAELGVHPAEPTEANKHQLWLMCDDVEKTKADFEGKGVAFTQPVSNQGWGITTAFTLPGAGEFWMYQPLHPMAAKQPPEPQAAAKPRPTAKAARKKAKKKAVSGTTRRTGRKSKKARIARKIAKAGRRRR